MNKKRFNSNQGFSLVELAIGLAVVTILILAISTSSGIRDNARVQSAAGSVQTLRCAAENYLAAGKLNYAGLTIDALKTAELLPANFTGSSANPWGGDFIIAANANNTRFDISLGGLPKTDADKLTAYFTNSANAAAYDESQNAWTVTF
ncbi:MAG: prepilin-type N-terminal cleavage/methylation domain-containing protein [Candidatus Omnitrophica bacterium]|nr:prepilin-type N-terminal cleavage/methylation domain-containing protein [Candidatus Omnitrophota bacterium]